MWAAGSSLGLRGFEQTLRRRGWRACMGFTLLELLVVISIIAAASAGVALALRDGTQTALDRDAQRLAVLFEAARAQSRATGVPVTWQAKPGGFEFTGWMGPNVPSRWLSASTRVLGTATVQLGPEPMIGVQAVDIFDSSIASFNGGINTIGPMVRIATDGLRPFSLQTPTQTKSGP